MSQFVYVTYIRTTPKKLWHALTDTEFQWKYWFGMHQESDWTKGSSWKMLFEDGRVADAGTILESDPPHRLVIQWQHELMSELKAEGVSRCTYEIEATGSATKLTVTHVIDAEGSKFIVAVSGGWPSILSSLKSLLETGEAMPADIRPPKKG